MRRTVVTVAVVLVVILPLGACGSDSVDTEGVAGPPADEPPTTTVPELVSTTTVPREEEAAAAIVPGDDPEVDAVVAAWTTVFDSSAPVENKIAFLEDAEALRATLEAYATAGEGVGGITLEPTSVDIDGDTASIAYDVNFAANEAYGDQRGEVVRRGGAWVVSRAQFCSFMDAARSPCP